jgi:ATP synthase F1 gamma subunit
MPSSAAVDKAIRGLREINDIVGVMKAYAGVAVRKAESVVANIRACEDNALRAMADLAARDPLLIPAQGGSGKRILAAFGSSLGLCGLYNEKMADEVAAFRKEGDALFAIGARFQDLLRARRIPSVGNLESPAGIDGIMPSLRDSAISIQELYAGREYLSLVLIYTTVTDGSAEIAVRQVLPPSRDPLHASTSGAAPLHTYEDPQKIFPLLLEEYLGLALHRSYVEALRSENWYRLRTMEAAGENLERRVSELGGLYHYVRQEEVTEEMLEILSGMYGR